MGAYIAKPSNKSMVDRLVEQNSFICTQPVEGVFRAVDRAMYFDLEEGEAVDPYDDDPWRRGNLHLSAPCIYAKVVEALDLKPGHSFLNLGSGTGYLNTVVGLLIGPNGVNHGVELHEDVVEYAYKKLQKFKSKSFALDKYDFAEPVFVAGNCLDVNPNNRYDRVYLGAACLPDLELFMKKLLKTNGGVLVMPCNNSLMKYVRVDEQEWLVERLMDVNFTLMIRRGDDETDRAIINMPRLPVQSLKSICRKVIRQQVRDKTNVVHPSLLHSDNVRSRRLRKAKAEERAKELISRNKDRMSAKELRSTLRRDLRRSSHSRGSCWCRRPEERIDVDDITASQSSRASGTRGTIIISGGSIEEVDAVLNNPAHHHRLITGPERTYQELIDWVNGPQSAYANTTNDYNEDTTSLSSSDEEEPEIGGNDNSNTTTSNETGQIEVRPSNDNECARTRPFIYAIKDQTHPRSNQSAPTPSVRLPSSLLPIRPSLLKRKRRPSSSDSSDSPSDANHNSLSTSDSNSRRASTKSESKRQTPTKRRQQKRLRRRENECQQYHTFMCDYINQLPLPKILHSFLNLDRDL